MATKAEGRKNLMQKAPPLTLENILKFTKKVRNCKRYWADLSDGFDIQHHKVAEIVHFNSKATDEDHLKAVIVEFLQGGGGYQPTWRAVIHALLYVSNGPYLALDDTLRSYSEGIKDSTFTVDNVVRVLRKIANSANRDSLMFYYVPGYQLNQILKSSSNQSEKIWACATYIVNHFRDPTWENLNLLFYNSNELTAAREAKSFLSTDPTLTVENVVQVMKATEIDKRLNLWALILFPENTAKILRSTARSDTYYAEIYVTCSLFSSWKHLAKQLYNQDQIQAVEKTQHHLPPRDLTVTTDKLKDLFVLIWDRDRVDAIGRKLCLPQLKIRQIQRNYRHPLERKEAYLDLYAYDHPCPSWIDVAEILLSLKLSQQFNMVNETYIKVSKETEQSFDTAMMDGELLMRNGSALFLGPGGSGKSHTLALFLEEDPPSIRESTPCMKKPVRALAHCKVGVSNDHLVRITDDQYSNMLVITAKRLPQSSTATTISKPSTVQKGKSEMTNSDSSSSTTEKDLEESSKSDLPPLKVDGRVVRSMDSGSTRGILRKEFCTRMQAESNTCDLNNKDMLDISDTGGQPMFHEVLPVFIRNTMFGIMTVKLNESLDNCPLVEYYTKGVPIGTPFESPFTHLETLHHCMKVIRSTCEHNACPKIAFVGTHKDLEHECPHEKREVKNQKLRSIIPQEMKDNIIVIEESLLLAINAKAPGKDDEKIISALREWILKELHKLEPVKIPLRYFALEMAFQRLAKYQRKSILSKEECYQEVSSFNFTHESFEAALKYLHGLKLIFYYEDVLPNVVFIDAQALLDKITELVVYSLSKSPMHILSFGVLEKFRRCGILTLEILSQFKSHYIPKFFEEKELILLFKYLRIIAKVGRGEYFMPCLLKKSDISHLKSVTSLQVIPALLFYFGQDGPKLGVFCFLLASLITEAKWKLLEEDGNPVQVSRNRVQFALPGRNPGCVTISDSFSTFFHVAIEPPEGVSADRVCQIYEEVCPTIRETILTGIRKASQKLNYHDSIPEVAFPCLNHDSTALHPATISSMCTGLKLLTCITHPRICSEMTEHHQLWLGCKDSEESSNVHVTDLEMSTTVAFDLDATPTLGRLSVLRTAEGKKIKIIEAVAPRWQTLGDQLEFDSRGIKLGLIKATHPTDLIACCREMFQHWLNGHGVRPCSWHKLIELLEDCDLAELAKEVHSAFS